MRCDRSVSHRQLFCEEVLLVEEQYDARPLEVGIAADALEQRHRLRHPNLTHHVIHPRQATGGDRRRQETTGDGCKSGRYIV